MISVALCTYNGEKFIEEQLVSIINQTKQPDEIIIVDDCSKDETISIISRVISYYEYTNITFKFFKNTERIGYEKNFFKAISYCNGDQIFLSDQDDIWINNKIEIMLKYMKNNKVKLLFSSYKCIDDTDKLLNFRYKSSNSIIYNFLSKFKRPIKYNYKLLFKYINIAGMSMAINKEIKNDLFNNDFFLIGYHDLAISIIATCKNSAYYIDDCLVKYRLHNNNSIGLSYNKKEDRALWLKKHIDTQQDILKFLDSLKNIDSKYLYKQYLNRLIKFNKYRLFCFNNKMIGIGLFKNFIYYSGISSLFGDLVYILKMGVK